MASAAGEIFDEYGGDAMEIAEELVESRRHVMNLVAMVEELRAMEQRAREVDGQKVPSIPSTDRNDLAADVARYILGES